MGGSWRSPDDQVDYPIWLCDEHDPIGTWFGAGDDQPVATVAGPVILSNRRNRLEERARRFLGIPEETEPTTARHLLNTFIHKTLPVLLAKVDVVTKAGVVDPVGGRAPGRPPHETHAYLLRLSEPVAPTRSAFVAEETGPEAEAFIIGFRSQKVPDVVDDAPRVPWWRDLLGRRMQPHSTACSCHDETFVREYEFLTRKEERVRFLLGLTPTDDDGTLAVPPRTWFDPLDHAEYATDLPAGWDERQVGAHLVQAGPPSDEPLHRWPVHTDDPTDRPTWWHRRALARDLQQRDQPPLRTRADYLRLRRLPPSPGGEAPTSG